jgi:hypothetical protein
VGEVSALGAAAGKFSHVDPVSVRHRGSASRQSRRESTDPRSESARSNHLVSPRQGVDRRSFAAQPTSANLLVRSISLGAQEQSATFFASHGATIVEATPPKYFETPILSPLPETLNFIR